MEGIDMESQPTLRTQRLALRPFVPADASCVQLLAGDRRVSRMTANIPYPYEDGLAEQWISRHGHNFQRRRAVAYAVTIAAPDELIGAISLTQMTPTDANLGFWIGVPYWGSGFCTEAASAMIEYAFSGLKLAILYARHLPGNAASRNVILKSGFSHAGQMQSDMAGGKCVLEHYELRGCK